MGWNHTLKLGLNVFKDLEEELGGSLATLAQSHPFCENLELLQFLRTFINDLKRMDVACPHTHLSKTSQFILRT